MRRLLLCLLLLGSSLRAEPVRYELDPEHLTVAFLVEHVGFAKVLGSFSRVTGSYLFDATTGRVTDLQVVVETGSVDTGHERRDEHLRSGDFLDSRKFPRMTFRAREARPASAGRYMIAGELELKGTVRPLTLAATLNKQGLYPIGKPVDAMGVSARGALKRSEYGMTYGVDNGWVGNDVELIIEFEARRQ